MTREVPEEPFYLALVGGSFQGKSLLACSLANRLGVPHILNTDLVRNILRAQHTQPPSWLGTSTYLLSQEELDRQCDAVSKTTACVLRVFERRGESAVLEGMHFSRTFIADLGTRPDVLLVGLANLLAYDVRVRYKIAATRLRGNLAKYREFKDRVEAIHKALLQSVADANGYMCRYEDIEHATAIVATEAHRRFRFIQPGQA